jgi:hypothetical protein
VLDFTKPARAPTLRDHAAVKRFLELLTGSPNSAVCFRIFDDKKGGAAKSLRGTLADNLTALKRKQLEGCGVFVVINEGGDKDAEITRVRALFVDFDNAPLPERWHVRPHWITNTSPGKHQAFWFVRNLPVAEFRAAQLRLAARYGGDPAVSNPSRVMRVPGFMHQKGKPFAVTGMDLTNA